MPTYELRLLDGQTLSMKHKARTLKQFVDFMNKRLFVTATGEAEEVGISVRGVATVKRANGRHRNNGRSS